MDKIETILAVCIQEIKSGRATVADCLNRYPDRQEELKSLLGIALNIQQPPPLWLDSGYKQFAKARLLQEISTAEKVKSRSYAGSSVPLQLNWARIAVSVLIAVILLSMLAGGTVYAAQDSLPGDLLYTVKRVSEDARLLMDRDGDVKVDLNMEFARTRLEEMSRLVNESQEKTQLALNGYQNNLAAAGTHMHGIANLSTRSTTLSQALEDLQGQLAFCDKVIDTNAKYLGPVREAAATSIDQQLEFLMLLAENNSWQAAQINIRAIQGRLQQALSQVNSQKYQLMQETLLQYRQFSQLGLQIQQIAKSTGKQSAEIEDLNSRALSGWLNILDSISRQSPSEYQGSIEASRQATLQYQIQEQQRHPKQVNGSSEIESPTSEDKGSSSTGQQNNQPASQTQDKGTGSSGGQYNQPASQPGNQTGNSNNTISTPTTPPSQGSDKGTTGNSGNGSIKKR